jgi:Tripartite tricarboxylate transporter family receptor
MMAGIKLVPVHYKGGGETLKDLISGQVKVMFSTIPPVLGLIKDGSLRGIATADLKRDNALPELPTIAESGLARVRGASVVRPAGAGRHPARPHRPRGGGGEAGTRNTKAALAAQDFAPLAGTPDAFGAFFTSEIAKWAKVIEVIGSIGD